MADLKSVADVSSECSQVVIRSKVVNMLVVFTVHVQPRVNTTCKIYSKTNHDMCLVLEEPFFFPNSQNPPFLLQVEFSPQCSSREVKELLTSAAGLSR